MEKTTAIARPALADQHAKTASERASDAEPALRVGFFVHDFPLLSETFVINQASALVQRGHDLNIFALYGRNAGSSPMHSDVERHKLRAMTSYAPAGSWFIDQLAKLHSAEEDANAVTRSLSVGLRSGAFAAESLLFAGKPAFDIVHCQFASLGLRALRHRRSGLLNYKRLIVHLRGYDISAYIESHGPNVYANLFKEADQFIANCEYFRNKAIALGCPPEKIEVIGSGLDTSKFRPKTYEPVNNRPTRLIAVGRLTEKKGLTYAIDAVAQLLREERDIEFAIVGSGPLKTELQTQIDELALRHSVILHGEKTHEEIALLLHRSDIMLAPSVSAQSGDEDAPVNSLKEAMAVGLPVIATNHGGIPELVVHGEHGYLTPERNAEALADALRRLLNEPERWPAMGREGRQRATEMYDQTKVAEQTVALYRRVLSHDANGRERLGKDLS